MTRPTIPAAALAALFCLAWAAAPAQEATAPEAQAAGDPAAGEAVFRKCRACHKTEPGADALGPNLHGIVGRDVASLEGYDYSDAMRAWGGGQTWTPALLNTFLEKPRQVVEGTRMTFAGLREPAERADIIAYLETLK